MADVVITLKVMLSSTDVDISAVEKKITAKISDFGGKLWKVEVEPIAFGLNALKFMFLMDESKGGTEKLEDDIKNLDEVSSVNVDDVRRAVG